MEVIQHPIQNWTVELDDEEMHNVHLALRAARDFYEEKSRQQTTEMAQDASNGISEMFDRMQLKWERMMEG